MGSFALFWTEIYFLPQKHIFYAIFFIFFFWGGVNLSERVLYSPNESKMAQMSKNRYIDHLRPFCALLEYFGGSGSLSCSALGPWSTKGYQSPFSKSCRPTHIRCLGFLFLYIMVSTNSQITIKLPSIKLHRRITK